jgi:hypothetical protein
MAPDDDFDLLNLDNRVSLNRTRLDGHEAIPAERRGLQAWDLLSAQAMRRELSRVLPQLDRDGADPIEAFDGMLGREAGGLAGATTRRFGEYLAYLLLSLLSPGDEQPAYRRYWLSIRRVVLGGGLMRGNLGRGMHAEARRVLAAAGRSDVRLELAPRPHLLGLIGAARSADEGAPAALVYDFGNSNVKRGLARYREGALVALEVRPSWSTEGLPDAIAGTHDAAKAQRLADFMTDVIAGDWRDAVQSGATPSTHIAASIACYLRDGQPLNYDAGYASLRLLSHNAAGYLSRAVSTAVGTEVTVTLSHDGTTAARVFAGLPHTAVVMLGTWLGVGFAPEDASGLRPLAPDFAVMLT